MAKAKKAETATAPAKAKVVAAKKPAVKKPRAKKPPPPPPSPPLRFPEQTMSEMLVWLAIKGKIPSAVPDWADGGTNFEKLQKFLEALGESGLDITRADLCFFDWMKDETVSPYDDRYQDENEDDEDDEDGKNEDDSALW